MQKIISYLRALVAVAVLLAVMQEEKTTKEDKILDKVFFIFVNEKGFDITDLNKNLLWSVEIKDNESLLKKGPNKEIAYKFSKFKQKASIVLDSYMLLDGNNNIRGVNWNKKLNRKFI